jgi:uncharacterized protein
MKTSNMKALQVALEMINAETQLLFASDWPHFDFDLPSEIYDLPFLTEQAERNILGPECRADFRARPDAKEGAVGRRRNALRLEVSQRHSRD